MLATLLAMALAAPAGGASAARLPPRVRRIVLHVPGGPSYGRPERRFVFLSPPETQSLWKPGFGTHWILWTDGSLWPRHPGPDEPSHLDPPVGGPADPAWRRRLAAQASPVYAHVSGHNADSVGIEVAHSGRSGAPFPAAQVHALAWLLETLVDLSDGRLSAADIFGHKDLDDHPAYVGDTCAKAPCSAFADEEGRPYRRRVDPPESLFVALRAEGIAIPRPPGAGDKELLRTEHMGPGIPRQVMVR